jgi:hypothetical protein
VIDVGGLLQVPRHRLGSLVSCAGLLLSWCSASACLVTDQIDYDRPNTPPQVTKEKPLGFRTVPPESECGGQGTGDRVPWMNFPISVRDVDIEDALKYRVLVNGKLIKADRIPQTGRVDRDFPGYCVERRDLKAACLHVEILVSQEFEDLAGQNDPYSPETPNDIGSAEWWVLGPAADFPEVGVGKCQEAGAVL